MDLPLFERQRVLAVLAAPYCLTRFFNRYFLLWALP